MGRGRLRPRLHQPLTQYMHHVPGPALSVSLLLPGLVHAGGRHADYNASVMKRSGAGAAVDFVY
jgi:hypothetical protein